MKITPAIPNTLFEPILFEDVLTKIINTEAFKFLIHRYSLFRASDVTATWLPSPHPLYHYLIDEIWFTRTMGEEKNVDQFRYQENGRLDSFIFRGVQYHINQTNIPSTGTTRYTIMQGRNTIYPLIEVVKDQREHRCRIKIEPAEHVTTEDHPRKRRMVIVDKNPDAEQYIRYIEWQGGDYPYVTRVDLAIEENQVVSADAHVDLANHSPYKIRTDAMGRVIELTNPIHNVPVGSTLLTYTHYNSDQYPYRGVTPRGMEYDIHMSSQLFRTLDRPFGELLPVYAEPISKDDPSNQTPGVDRISLTRIMEPSMTYEHFTGTRREVYNQDRTLCAITTYENPSRQLDVYITSGKDGLAVYRDVVIQERNRVIYSSRHYSDGRVVKRHAADAIWK